MLNESKKRVPWSLTVLITFFVSIAPVFKNYGVWIISLSEIFLVCMCALLILFKAKHDFYKIRLLFLFFFIVTLLSLIAALKYPFSHTVIVRFWIYIFFIFSFCDYFDFELGCKILVYAILINSLYLIFQNAVYSYSGKVLQWNIPGLPVKIAEGYLNGEANEAYGIRFSGLFSEPAQFSHYALTGVIVLLLKKDIFRPFFRVTLLAVIVYAILLSGSGAGAVQLLIIFALFFLKSFKESRNNVAKIFAIVFLIFVSTSLLIPFISYFGLDSGWLRAIDNSSIASANSRIYNCFKVFEHLPNLGKIFGIGYGNYQHFLDTKLFGLYSRYCNSAAFVLCGSGYLGFALYLSVFYDWFRHTKGVARFKLITLFISAFYSGQALSIDFVLSACFILSCYEYRKEEKGWIV